MTSLVYGKDINYDASNLRCQTPVGPVTLETVKANVQNMIDSSKKLIIDMGEMMDKSCVSGYSWVASMNKDITYYEALYVHTEELLNKYWSKDNDGNYMAFKVQN